MVKSVRYVEGIIRPPRNQQLTTVMLVGTPSMFGQLSRATRGIFSTSEEVAHSAGSRPRWYSRRR